ncbi:MAG: protein kinase domain-containing protein [Bryobacteraceae bacterium]
MSPEITSLERWRRLEAIFGEVVEIPAEERTARLAALCAGDSELLEEASSLLRAADEAEQATASFVPPEPREVEAGDTHIGRRIGPYELERLLGRGGMGAVYLARRADGQFDQQVAIKLIDLPLAGSLFRERFRQERQILAGLSHPFIARLLDGGVSEDGELYLAMEYADGLPIQRYCEQHALTIRRRLELFRSVCAAVHFAHQNLIVHRDLKPDNILVLEDGTPKLLDFGTAKLLTPVEGAADSEFTRQGFYSYTPQYASPEQVLGQPISTASDVYSLGVLLFLLVTGEMPYELREFSTAEMVRVICEQQPPRPSEKAARSAIDSDIDAIVLKALRKEPAARYTSVDQLIGDLEAYLGGRPVAAQQGSFRYYARKFARRNKVALAASALLAATLLAGIAGVLWQARIANLERRKAEARVDDLRKLSNSLLSEINGAIQKIPGSTAAQKLLVSVVLDHLDRAAQDSSGDPQLELDLANAYTRLGNVQGNPYRQNIGDTQGASASLDKAAAIAAALVRQQPGNAAAARALALALQSRSEVLFGIGRTPEAVVAMRAATAIFDELASRPGARAAALIDAAAAYGDLGDELGFSGETSLGDPVAGLAAYRKSLEINERIVRLDPTDTRALSGLALVHAKIANEMAGTDPGAALPEYHKAIDGLNAVSAEARKAFLIQRTLAFFLRNLGEALKEVGRYKEALYYLEQTKAIDLPFLAADPNDEHATVDLMATLQNEAECFEDRAEAVFTNEPANRAADAASIVRSLSEARPLNERLIRIEPDDAEWQSALGLLLIRISLQQQALHEAPGSLELAARGVAILKVVGRLPSAKASDMDWIARGLTIVMPVQLRDPKLAVNCAERAVEMSHHREPAFLRTLALAYRAAGQPEKAHAAAKEGLALLPAANPATVPSRIRKQLQAEAAK